MNVGTRRSLTKYFLGLAATAAIVAVFVFLVFNRYVLEKRFERVTVSTDQRLAFAQMIREKYGVEVTFADHVFPVSTYHGPIQGANAEMAKVKRYSVILSQGFGLYPPDFIRRSLLKRIVLCRGLAFGGQNRAAVPDFQHDTLYLDVVAGDYNRSYQRRTIHHDFYHMVDYRDDGELAVDTRWAPLNPENFRYGSGGVTMQNDPMSGWPGTVPVFLASTRLRPSRKTRPKSSLI